MTSDKLYFYSKSKDVYPGKGTNEYVEDTIKYSALSKVKDWRKTLSNFHFEPFKYNGYTWNTIEHVFQSKKIQLVDPEKAKLFTIESGNEIGKGDGLIARKNRKLVKLSKEQLNEWSKIKNKVLFEAAFEKYKQSESSAYILKSTNDAELWHIVMRGKPERFTHLEKVRSMI